MLLKDFVKKTGFIVVQTRGVEDYDLALPQYSTEMKASIAHLLGISENQVGVKATTNEKLGAVGRREGMAALASVIIYRK